MLFEHFLCRNTFDNFYHNRRSHVWDGLYKKVNMIFIGAYFNKTDFISLAYCFADVSQCFFRVFSQNLSSVLYGTNDVIQKQVPIMSLVDVFSHVPIVSAFGMFTPG